MRHAGQELRRLAVEELIKRREVRRCATPVCSVQMPAGHARQDIGWIVEGDFDEYVARPRLPRSPGSYDDFSCAKTVEHLQDGSARNLGRRARAPNAFAARPGDAAGGQGLSSSIDLRGRACSVAFRCIWWRTGSSSTSSPTPRHKLREPLLRPCTRRLGPQELPGEAIRVLFHGQGHYEALLRV